MGIIYKAYPIQVHHSIVGEDYDDYSDDEDGDKKDEKEEE